MHYSDVSPLNIKCMYYPFLQCFQADLPQTILESVYTMCSCGFFPMYSIEIA